MPLPSDSPSCSLKSLLSSFRLRSSTRYHLLSPPPPPRTHSRSRSFSSRRPSLVPVILHNADQLFFVHPHILDHWLFQDLLRTSVSEWPHPAAPVDSPHSSQPHFHRKGRRHYPHRRRPGPIFLNCDSILFEFFIWLVENDDPSLRDLDLNDLMEFYSGGAEAATSSE